MHCILVRILRVLGLYVFLFVACSQPVPMPITPTSPSIASLMGDMRQKELAARISASGSTWQQNSAWGRELITQGFVAKPPHGPAPSPKLSQHFNCINCHNVAREDPSLPVQDPEARLAYIQSGPDMYLTQGTTFWGITNRVSFYNDYYAQYRGLCVPVTTTNTQIQIGGPDSKGNCGQGTRKMNAESLEDALQVCSAYCSEGRYMLRWELDAVMAYLWDLQVHLVDLELTDAEKTEIVGALISPTANSPRAQKARELLATKYLQRAGDVYRDVPALKAHPDGSITVGAYHDGITYTGNAERGKLVYEKACLHCHGTPINPLTGAALIANVELFYSALAKGIPAQDTPYMPEYTLQRLSRQQSADVQAYLESLRK